MKKLILFLGAAIGFLFGSRAGRRPYEQVETKLRKVMRRKDVRDAASNLRTVTLDKLDEVHDSVGETVRNGFATVRSHLND